MYSRLGIDFHLGETGDKRLCRSLAPVIVSGDAHQPDAGQRFRRLLSHHVEVLRHFVSIVLAAHFDRALRGLRVAHAAARAALAEHPLIADGVIFGTPAEFLRCDLLQLLFRVHGRGVVSA